MKGTKTVLAMALASAVLGFAGPAAAQAGVRNAYVGASFGQAEYKDGCNGVANCEEKDTARRIFCGYRGKLEGRGADESNTDLTYGAGLRYDLTRSVGLRVEWQRYSKMGDGALVETDVDVLGAGILYRFQ